MEQNDLSRLRIEKTGSTGAGPQKRRLLLLSAGFFAVIVTFLLLKGLLSPALEIETATVGAVYPSQGFTLLNASGYVVAQRKAAVASKITGRLISLSVEEGNTVKKGAVIATMENEDARALLDQAAANLNVSRYTLEQAKAELADAGISSNREKDLLAQGFTTRAAFDAADARLRKAEAAVHAAESAVKASTAGLRSAEVALDYSFIRAPFDAVVLTKNADIGDIITPIGAAANAKAAVVTLADMGSLQVEVDVSESNIGKVSAGQPCEIQLDALPDIRFRGEVHMIVPTADRTKSSVLVKVRFIEKDKRVLPEMSAKVAFLGRRAEDEEMKPRIAIRPDAIRTADGRSSVFLVRDNTAGEVQVKTGEKIGDMVVILEGVKPGDKIITRLTEKVRDGRKVKIIEK